MLRFHRFFWVFLVCMAGCSPGVVELEWHQEEGYRWAKVPSGKSGKTGFEELSSRRTGVTFNNFLSDERIAENRVLLNGSGLAAGDIDGNGRIDLYFTRLDGPNKLYRNLGGYRFEDITDEAGVAHEGSLSTGAVFADVNGNGHLDLLVTSINRENSLYLNDGTGRFRLAEQSGLGSAKGSMTMALADITGNGYPDLYVTNYRERSVKDIFPLDQLSPDFTMRGDSLIPPFDDFYAITETGPREIGEMDELYLNNGDGTFTEVRNLETRFLDSDGNPKGLERDWGLTAKFQDLNDNGLPDLYVANDFWTPDRIWINQGGGVFKEIDRIAIRNSSYSAMAVDFSDINRNGFTDIFVTEMLATDHEMRLRQVIPSEPDVLRPGEFRNRPRYNRNSLYLNRGDNTYTEISYYSGLEASDWSWAVRFMDIDLDGYEDVIVSTGFMYDLQDMDAQLEIIDGIAQSRLSFEDYILQFPPLRQQNRIFRNNGLAGREDQAPAFSDVSSGWGFTAEDISHGMAVADLNNNGSLDLIINRMNEEAVIYRNLTDAPRIAVRLKGKPPSTQALGAKVKLQGGPVETQTKQITGGGDYLSGSDPLVVFAADPENPDHQLLITWPDGTDSRIGRVQANRIYEVEQETIGILQTSRDFSQTGIPLGKSRKISHSLFDDATHLLNHIHHEDPFDDFRIQQLLPYRLSHLGPGIALIDITQDGNDELLIGTGKGGKMQGFRIADNGKLLPLDLGPLGGRSDGDQTAIVGWREHGRTHLVVGLANYEIGTEQAPSALHVQMENGQVVAADHLPGVLSTTGPLAAADYTGNGSVDLFVGGRFLPGRYPEDADSRLFRNEGGQLVQDEENSPLFEGLGLVTGAIFTDYNRSGEQDLVVTTEWGTVRLFENNGGVFTERTADLGLDRYKGWWQGIASGDFTGNGYPDLVAANIGKNSPYRVGYPLKLYYDDWNRNGNPDILEAYYDPGKGDYVPRRQLQEFASIQLAFGNVRTHRLFAVSSVGELLGLNPDHLPQKEINTMEHMVFLNREGEGFEARPLPAKAQFSAGFFVGVADMDNDGHEDIFLSQNFFAVADPQKSPRMDGGRGLWLKGDRKGNFESVPGHLSGIKVYGDQRGAALGDITGNGKTDLIVSQNAAGTRLFLNNTEQRGVRVRLTGPPENEWAIGAVIRLVYDDGTKGPARSVQAGSGYWSQNSTTQVLGMGGVPSAIEIHWPDGTLQMIEFEERMMDYEVKYRKNR